MSKTSHDISGIEWARLSHLKPGDRLRADGGFTCILEDATPPVKAESDGRLYVPCSDGRHYLDGQADDGEHLVGMYHTQ